MPRYSTIRGFQQGVRLGAAVGLDVADDDVHPVGPLLTGGFEHRVGLADSGRGAEEHLELAAARASLFFLDAGQERFGIGPHAAHGLSVALTPVERVTPPRR